jgi:hypothetical protein
MEQAFVGVGLFLELPSFPTGFLISSSGVVDTSFVDPTEPVDAEN